SFSVFVSFQMGFHDLRRQAIRRRSLHEVTSNVLRRTGWTTTRRSRYTSLFRTQGLYNGRPEECVSDEPSTIPIHRLASLRNSMQSTRTPCQSSSSPERVLARRRQR